MNDQIKFIKGFMHPEDAMLISDYARSVDLSFTEFGMEKKSLHFMQSFKTQTLKAF